MELEKSVTTIKGVGSVLAGKLASVGVQTIEDLLYFFPRRYEDFSHITKIADIQPGKVTIKAQVESITGRHLRRKLHITEAVLDDGSSKTRAVWFNQPYRADHMKKGDVFYFSGNFDLQRGRYVLASPAVEREADFSINTGRIVPIYPEAKGIRSLQIRKLLRELMPLMQLMPDTLPAQLVKRERLMPLGSALQQLHFPDDIPSLQNARDRLGFQEIFELMLASQLNKRDNAALQGYHIPFKTADAKTFTDALPFTMTNAQKRAAWEIAKDFERAVPMNRLLQGDVGSGKTVVAAMAASSAARAGYQTALMAPTEILAAQHAETLAKILQPLGITMALLVGSVKPAAKKILLQKIASGDVDIVVGTHALIQKDVQFHKLGFVVIDEQHRFGVNQRAELLKKSTHMPHLLSMTATPIPRSLQLTVYGELAVSVIDELPAGRQPIQTQLFTPYQRRQVYEKIEDQLQAGRQAYIVCPAIGAGVDSELKSVEAEYDKLRGSIFSHRRIGMLHGKLKPDEKDTIMQQFKNGKLEILISTTVIEVGVDIPNATVMLIEGAERFGLAQLHQLRGRVGRGGHQSFCFLMPSSGKQPSERLLELEKSQDGFYLAEADLKLRGPGEIYGRMQHGSLNLNIADLTDLKQIKRVQKAAEWLLESGINLLQYKQLGAHVSRYRGITSLN